MRGKQIHFFALGSDIRSVLEGVEAKGALAFVETGNRTDRDFARYERVSEIPSLGIADHGTGSVCRGYLVADAERPIRVRTMTGLGGVTRYLVDQLENPGTVVFRAAGRWKDGVVLSGSVGTICESAEAAALVHRFRTAIKASFTRVKAFWVGHEAKRLFDGGVRFTMAEQSPAEFDLRA